MYLLIKRWSFEEPHVTVTVSEPIAVVLGGFIRHAERRTVLVDAKQAKVGDLLAPGES